MATLQKLLTLLLALAGIAALVVAGVSCSESEEVAGGGATTSSTQALDAQPTTTATVPLEPAEIRVRLRSEDGTVAEVRAEVADKREELSQGLMHRRSLPQDQGMLFVFPREGNYAFWMKNTLIPLDMIFINEARQIVGVVENAQPHTTEPRAVAAPSRFVLEVNAGWVKRHRVAVGDRVEFVPSPAL